jgi:hypothetical protein
VNQDKQDKCLKLNKAIYGLKQALLAWFNRLSSWLKKIGFSSAVSNPCVFFQINADPVWLFVHFNDIAVFGKNLTPFKDEIKLEFDMKDLGQANVLLGIKILHDDTAIILTQHHYIDSLLDLYGMHGCRPVSTPLVPNLHLTHATVKEQDRFMALGVNFRSAVRALSYLSSAT